MFPITDSYATSLLFIIGFSLHNFEEALWLPEWSKHAKKYHKKVEKNEFRFAALCITIIGFIITSIEILYGNKIILVKYVYLGFIAMMIVNAIFPHLVVTIVLRKYAPGLITGLLLNIPIGIIILISEYRNGINVIALLVAFICVSVLIISLLNPLFKIGARLLSYLA